MKLYYLTILALVLHHTTILAQVSFNRDQSPPHPSAMVDIKSTEHGLLIPRLSSTARTLLPSPATGLLIFNADNNRFEFYNGNTWQEIASTQAAYITGTVKPGGGIAISVDPLKFPDSSAMLDAEHDFKGILIPRTDPSQINNPAEGLLIYNNITNRFNYFNGTSWLPWCSWDLYISGATGSQPVSGVAVNQTSTKPHHSAVLDIDANARGFLMPRLSETEKNALNAAVGLVIYDSTANIFQFFDGIAWNTLMPLNTATVTITASSNPVCIGETVVFTATSQHGGYFPLYQWLVNGLPAGTSGSQFNYIPQPGDTVNCMLYSNEFCVENTIVTSNTIQMSVNTCTGIIITQPSLNITQTSAISGGNITDEGGAPVTSRGVCWSAAPAPSIAGYHTVDGSGPGTFSSTINGLDPGTTYFVRAYATNSFGTFYGNTVTFTTTDSSSPCPGLETVTYGGQVYHTVQIGTQCWFKENLNIGVQISGVQQPSDNGTIEKYCYDDLTVNCDIYGGLYKWNEMMQYAAVPMSQGICPPGWHIPGQQEYQLLTDFLGGHMIAGGKMKMTGTSYWNPPNTGATNESHFSAKGAGYKDDYCCFSSLKFYTSYWTSTPDVNPGNAGSLYLYNDVASIYNYNADKNYGFSVRCIKSVNAPPVLPYDPDPATGSANQPVNTVLAWSCSDPDNDPLLYDLYFGTTNPPSLVVSGLVSPAYDPGVLSNATTYFWKVVVHDGAGHTTAGTVWTFSTPASGPCYGAANVVDFQGNVYPTVEIGNQCWMAANLKTGTMIPGIVLSSDNDVIEKYCQDNDLVNCDVYGALYSWNEVMQYSTTPGIQGICPSNWHVPTDGDWAILNDFLGGTFASGGPLKATGTLEGGTGLWWSPNTGATNASGFSALPGGFHELTGLFAQLGQTAKFWTSTESSLAPDKAWARYLGYSYEYLGWYYDSKVYGFSVRCIRNQP